MRHIIFGFLMAGCSSIVSETAEELDRLSPLEADPSKMAVAINLPEGFGVYPNSAVLHMAVARKDIEQARSEDFVLKQSGSEWTIFEISQKDHARLADIQSLARNWEVEDSRATRGEISVDLQPCKTSEAVARSAVFSISLRLSPDAGFMPLVRNAPVSSILSRRALKDVPFCPSK